MKSAVEALVGQLFITGMAGSELDTCFETHYSQCPSGGFILFGRNVHDPAQVQKLTSALSDLALAHSPDYGPPFIAVDQEGGTLSPLRGMVTSFPGNMGLAATGDPQTVMQAGYVTGRDLSFLGINTNFAPVLDLAREPLNPAVGTRSFGDDPRRVAEFGVAYARGLLEAGVLFVAKHFPGHGGVSEDSHFSLPKCMASRSDLMARDVIPFIEVAKLPHAAMMVAHIRFSDLDPFRPASLSYPLVTGLLREEIGFEGVVLTDCLEMAGVREVGSVPEAAVMAIEAGCDIVLISHTPELQKAAFAAVREAVLSGRITNEQVKRSVARIGLWKRGLKMRASSSRLAAPDLLMDDLGERVITFLEGDPSRPWHFGSGALVLVTPAMDQITPAEDTVDVSPLVQELESHSIRCARVSCSTNPSPREIRDIVARIEDSLRAVSGTGYSRIENSSSAMHYPGSDCRAGIPALRVALVVRKGGDAPGQSALAAAIAARWDLLLIGIRDPRETRPMEAELTHRAPAILTYSTERVVLSALARVLAGEVEPRGVMPVRM